MSTVIVTNREGEVKLLAGREGYSVMEIIRDGGIDELLALCGGSCSCATCHVYVEDTFLRSLPSMGRDEDELLGCFSSRKDNSRLSCQMLFNAALDGLRVMIAPEC